MHPLFMFGFLLAVFPRWLNLPPLSRAHYLPVAGFAWPPIAFALYTLQSMWLMTHHAAILGFAPLHLMTIGYFGSMLVAMVTRVTHSHSGAATADDRHPVAVLRAVAMCGDRARACAIGRPPACCWHSCHGCCVRCGFILRRARMASRIDRGSLSQLTDSLAPLT